MAHVRAGGSELREHPMGRRVANRVTRPARPFADRLGEVRLADAGRPDDQDILLLVDEVARRQVDDLGLGHLWIERPVEVLEVLGALETGPPHPQIELLGFPALDFVRAEAQQELGVAEVVIDGLLRTKIERLQDTR